MLCVDRSSMFLASNGQHFNNWSRAVRWIVWFYTHAPTVTDYTALVQPELWLTKNRPVPP